MKSKFVLTILFSTQFFFIIAGAQDNPSRFSFLRRGSYFEPIILDPTECQTSAGLYKLWVKGSDENSGVYIPVNVGFQQSIVRYDINDDSGFEFRIGAAAFTQFTIKKMESNTYLGEMENTDYKLSFYLNYKYKAFSLRFRAFHKSSHLADDYILRNNITEANPGTLNFEQLDLTGSYQFQQTRIYGGIGMVITPNAVRERFSAQAGFIFRKSKKTDSIVRYVLGSDIKIFQQNNFTPNLRIGTGIEIGKIERTHIAFLIEYYNGHLPYSVLEYMKVQWVGASLVLLSAKK